MAKREIVCCSECGRDTTSKSGVCARCWRGSSSVWGGAEQVGRKTADTHFSGSPLAEPDDKESAADEYHGDTFRDDV